MRTKAANWIALDNADTKYDCNITKIYHALQVNSIQFDLIHFHLIRLNQIK